MAKNDAYEITKLEPYAYDMRLIERSLGDGKLKAKDVDAYLAKLPDLADNAETFEVVLGEDATGTPAS